MRDLYFVPDRFSPLLSDTSKRGGVYFSISPVEADDLPLRVLCGRACILLAGGRETQSVYEILQIDDPPYFEECFKRYTGLTSAEYRTFFSGGK